MPARAGDQHVGKQRQNLPRLPGLPGIHAGANRDVVQAERHCELEGSCALRPDNQRVCRRAGLVSQRPGDGERGDVRRCLVVAGEEQRAEAHRFGRHDCAGVAGLARR